MRRIVTFIFTLFYALVSTGAPALLHFCGHEQNMHLSIAHEDHHSTPSCCHAAATHCEAPGPKAPTSADQEDCCITSHVDLDDTTVSQEELTTIFTTATASKSAALYLNHQSAVPSTRGPILTNGPPLYLRLQQIIVYS
ncbi:MAG: hypothetical protein ACPG9M_03625 [Schleiferiaceae bacterium]|jgi:hypothetical protein